MRSMEGPALITVAFEDVDRVDWKREMPAHAAEAQRSEEDDIKCFKRRQPHPHTHTRQQEARGLNGLRAGACAGTQERMRRRRES